MTGADLLRRVIARAARLENTSGISFVDAMNAAVEMLFMRLWERRADLCRASLSLTTAIYPVVLPVTFRGFAEDPYLLDPAGNVFKLALLPAGGAASMAEETVEPPIYYRLTGSNMTLFPPPVSTTYDVRGEYFSHPGVMSDISTMPWGGLFNEVLVDATVGAIQFGGISGMFADQALMLSVEQSIDRVLPYRTRTTPRSSGSYFF